MYMNVFSTVAFFDKPFLVVAVMVTRVISYYGCLIVSGAFTLGYHVAQNGKAERREKLAEVIEDIGEIRPVYSSDFGNSVNRAEERLDKKRETLKNVSYTEAAERGDCNDTTPEEKKNERKMEKEVKL